MTLRETLRACVRAWQATASDINEMLTTLDRLLAQDARARATDAALAAPTRAPEPLAYHYRSIETLLSAPTVDADRSRHVFPPDGGIEAGAAWLALAYPHPWNHATTGTRELYVACWLEKRTDLKEGVWV